MRADLLRIAHLSDPHFTTFTLDPKQFLSKRWMGNWNFQLFRKRKYQTKHLWDLPNLFQTLQVDAVFITGDFSSTSLDEEYQQGSLFVNHFHEAGLPIFALPGNHDSYIRQVEQKRRFYDFFPSHSLQKNRVESRLIQKGWWYVGLDCTISTPLFCAYGIFNDQVRRHLEEALSSIPPTERIIMSNHFPLFATGRPLHDLKGASALQTVLKKFPRTTLYLHGHDHHSYIIDSQDKGLPLTLNSGSCSYLPEASFFILDLSDMECFVQQMVYRPDQQKNAWVMNWQKNYHLK